MSTSSFGHASAPSDAAAPGATAKPALSLRRPGMRAVLALAVGALSFAAVAAAGLLAGRASTERLRDGAAAGLAQAARHIADTLDRGMFERWRDVQVAAAHPALRDPAAAPDAKREALRLLDRTYPDYAITALIGPDGRVVVTSRGILEGVDVSGRDYFTGGRSGPYAGDVHDAILMAKHLEPRPNGEPPRFVDLAAPVAAPDGGPPGVLAAHLFWDWAEGVQRGVLEPLRAERPGAEALVLARDGTVLLGPAPLRGSRLAGMAAVRAAGAGQAGARLESWPDAAFVDGGAPGRFVVGYAPSRGHGGYPGLGWTVLVRQDSAAAFAAARALEREILLWACAVALVAAAVGWLLAHAATLPIRALTAVAERLAREPDAGPAAQREAAGLARGAWSREGAALGAAMAGLIGAQRSAAAAIAAEEARLRAVLDRMPVGVVLAEVPSGRVLMRNRRAEEVVGRPPAPAGTTAGRAGAAPLGARGGRPVAAENRLLDRAVRNGEASEAEVFRLRRGDGTEAWIEVSATRLADPAGGLLAIATLSDVTCRKAAEEALRESEERLRAVVDATPECVKLVGHDTTLLQMNPAGLRMLGAAPEEVVGRPLPELVAPEHRELWAANHARVCGGESLVWEFDIVTPRGRRRSLETHAVPFRPHGGGPLAHLGVTRDVTERKAAAERQALLVRELDHRAKNALAVVQAALRLTPKDDPGAYAKAVEGRVAALARAHALLAKARWSGADLRAMAEGELAPFLGAAPGARGAVPRAELDGPPLALKPGTAQALSMALHELATNATKHGALSAPGGRVSLSWWVDPASGELRLRWAERGGPPVAAPPTRRGFGSRVLEATVRGQLGGRVSRAWEPAGLLCDMEVPLAQAAPLAA